MHVMQVAYLQKGGNGFVQRARDKVTGEEWAIKFIARGDKVSLMWVAWVPGRPAGTQR